MSSDSSSPVSTTGGSGPPAPRPAAGLMKFMFTSGPAHQDLSRPLALEDLMTGDVSRLTRRHEDFGGPGLLRSLPAKRLALSRPGGVRGSVGSQSSGSSDSSTSSASSSESGNSNNSSVAGGTGPGAFADSESSESTPNSQDARSSQTSTNSGAPLPSQSPPVSALFSAPDELPPELPEETGEDIPELPEVPEPPESLPEPPSVSQSAGAITVPPEAGSDSPSASAQNSENSAKINDSNNADNSDNFPPQNQSEVQREEPDTSENKSQNWSSPSAPPDLPENEASPEPQVAVALAGPQTSKQPFPEEDSSEPLVQILQPRVQSGPAPPRPALAERTQEEQPAFEVPELMAESEPPSELPPIDDSEWGREEPPAARERVPLPRETPVPVSAVRERRKNANFRLEEVELAGQVARRELRGKEVQTERLPAEVVARPARSVDVQVNYVDPDLRGIAESGV